MQKVEDVHEERKKLREAVRIFKRINDRQCRKWLIKFSPVCLVKYGGSRGEGCFSADLPLVLMSN